MSLDWFLARRYLASRKGGRLLSFITAIALGGVTVGVTALIVVIGVMTGMQRELKSKILEADAHLIVQEVGSNLRLYNWQAVLDSVRKMEGVTAASPAILSNVAIKRGEFARAVNLVGVLMDTTGVGATSIEQKILDGVHNLQTPESGLSPMLLGVGLASTMQLYPGDTVTVIALENIIDGPLGPIPSLKAFEITGTFATGMQPTDFGTAYVGLEDAQDLLSLRQEDAVSILGVQVEDIDRSREIARQIEEALGFPYLTQSWEVRNGPLFNALQLEKLAMFLILSLIVLVAAFNIVSTLVLVVADRTREIGILKSMGMSDNGILRVFVMQGAWIGVVGALAGTTLGVVISLVIDERIPIPGDIYFVESLPVVIDPMDVLTIFLTSVLVAFLATIYPALQAARLQPVEAIRHD